VNRERLKGHLDLLLLSVLAAGPAHGYAIITALRARSEGAFDLPEGTVYPALHQLVVGRGRAQAPGVRADQQGRDCPRRRARRVEAVRGRGAGGTGVVGVSAD